MDTNNQSAVLKALIGIFSIGFVIYCFRDCQTAVHVTDEWKDELKQQGFDHDDVRTLGEFKAACGERKLILGDENGNKLKFRNKSKDKDGRTRQVEECWFCVLDNRRSARACMEYDDQEQIDSMDVQVINIVEKTEIDRILEKISDKKHNGKMLPPSTLIVNDVPFARIPKPLIEASVITNIYQMNPQHIEKLFAGVDARNSFLLKAEVIGLKKKRDGSGIIKMSPKNSDLKLMIDVWRGFVELLENQDERIWRHDKQVIMDCYTPRSNSGPFVSKKLTLSCGNIYQKTIQRLGVELDTEDLKNAQSLSDAVLNKCQSVPINRPCYHLKEQFATLFYKEKWKNLSDDARGKIIKAEKELWK